MFEIIYVSRALVDINPEQMEQFLGSSRARNRAADISGMLLHVRDENAGAAYFVQVMEGRQASVERTFHRISADELHTDVTVVHRGVREQRSFRDWQMGLVTIGIDVAVALTRHHSPGDRADTTLAMLSNSFLARALLELGAKQAREADV